jgi:ABC-type transport system involved in multi-copper enzyme maturation permease subunit
MRPTKVWLIASKDFRIFRKTSILYSIIVFEVVVSIGLPFILRRVVETTGARAPIPVFIDSFSFWFVIGSAMIPISIASYSIVGEKVQKSLEPLLATPITDEELLAGKATAAFIPAIISTYIGAFVFMTLVDQFTSARLGYRYLPNWNIGVILLLLAPLACILSVGTNVLVSSRVNDVRTAQQMGAFILMPFAAVYVLSEVQILSLTISTLLLMSLVLFIVDLGVFYLVKATFQREEILTKWS